MAGLEDRQMNDMRQYWVVGATWGGRDDQAPKLIRRGHWFLGWSDDQAARSERGTSP